MDFNGLPKKINHNCPLCGAKLKDNDLHVVKEEQDGYLIVYSSCLNCSVGMIAKLSMLPHGLIGVGILTDMNKEELVSINFQEVISAEDVLKVKLIADKGYLKINK